MAQLDWRLIDNQSELGWIGNLLVRSPDLNRPTGLAIVPMSQIFSEWIDRLAKPIFLPIGPRC